MKYKPANTEVACIIVNWNKTSETLRCIKSIQGDECPSDIILVDNASSDQEALKGNISNLHFISLLVNKGFAGGVNAGIEYAIKNKAYLYIVLINNDAWPVDNAILKMIECIRDGNNIAAVSPKIFFPDHKTIWSAGGTFNYFRLTGSNRGRGSSDSKIYNNRENVIFASACAIMVKSSVFSDVGLFDSEYVNYYEDVDFCLRIRKKKMRIVYCPEAHIMHEGSLSAGAEYGEFVSFYRYRNRLILLKKHGNVLQILFNIFFLPLLCLRDFIWYVRYGKFRAYMRLWKGVFDFFLVKRKDVTMLERERKQ